MITFQCDLYHFRNLKGLDLERGNNDINLLQTIRRENLDVCWTREPRSVEVTRRDSKNIVGISQSLCLSNNLPKMGPFTLCDTQGMSLAICNSIRSLDKCRYQSTLQYESVRQLRSAYSNVWHTSKHTLTTSVMVQDIRKTYITSCPSYSLWLARFMTEIYKRIGDMVKQDKAVTLDDIYKLVESLEIGSDFSF